MNTFMFIIMGFASTICLANPITPEEAQQNVVKFLNAQHSEMKKVKGEYKTEKLTLAYTRKNQNEQNLFYVFNREGNEGYVIASADDCAESVLGYSERGEFNFNQLPCNMRWWLERYARQIEYAKQNKLQVVAVKKARKQSILPLLETTWDQYEPCNNLCPIDPETGKRSITGCVATAQAQVMYYHRWPEKGIGSHSYKWRGKTLSVDFSTTMYQWSKMKKNYSWGDTDPSNAVATLIYHCGVSLETQYGSNGSWAYFMNGESLSTHFGYSNLYQEYWRDDNPDIFNDVLYDNISQQLPVLIGGQDLSKDEGHMFVCDGYKESDETYHINWGWGGLSDGHFKITDLYTYNGIRYYNYSDELYMVCNIIPQNTTTVNLDRSVESREFGRFLVDGYRLLSPKPGLNIVKMDDGSVRKEIVR